MSITEWITVTVTVVASVTGGPPAPDRLPTPKPPSPVRAAEPAPAPADPRPAPSPPAEEPEPEPEHTHPPEQDDSGQADVSATLQAIAECESGADPQAVNEAGPYYGAWQWSESTWDASGGEQYADTPLGASYAQQAQIAAQTMELQGPGAWPNCP